MTAGVRNRIAGTALAAALVVFGLTIWGWNTAPTDATADPAAVPQVVGRSLNGTANPSTGCGAAPEVRPGTTDQRALHSSGHRRTYLVHVPGGYRPDRAVPVVIAFHGRGQSGRIIESQTGLSNLPTIAVYPDGEISDTIGVRAWQNAPYANHQVDDIAFTEALMRSVAASYCVNLDQVFLVGHSNGGGFAAMAGCKLADRVTAVAMVSAAMYDETDGCPHPMSAFELHGTNDTIIPYSGAARPGIQVPDIASWVRSQAAVNGCTTEPDTDVFGVFVTRFTFSDCASNHPVVHLRVRHGGHAWHNELIGDAPLYSHIWQFLTSASAQA